MHKNTVSLRDAKAHLSALSERAAAGEESVITKRGRPVARLTAAVAPRKPVDLSRLQSLTHRIPHQSESAGQFMRDMRDQTRY